MHKVVIAHQCGCFRRSDLQESLEIASKDEALSTALSISQQMNAEFCGKHDFQVLENGQDFVIAFAEQPYHGSGCCGGGCGSH